MGKFALLVVPVFIIGGVVHSIINYRTVKKDGGFSKKFVLYGLISGIFIGIYVATVMHFELNITALQFFLVTGAFSLFGWLHSFSTYSTRKTLGKK
ncbi:hypothetical protein CN514_10950 [Bacillus sp. AFS001701]|uniref:hypothetical protein n=1 Tax=Bacillus sp. AFS001701 TaxID=2033480 RepID=UPI000BFA96E9|nr:hypothetical protein [Bacillus sp. AFS001701]PET66912.1 hypothetical protein CN514_10950 [Bacillus sp. AFS001701]